MAKFSIIWTKYHMEINIKIIIKIYIDMTSRMMMIYTV